MMRELLARYDDLVSSMDLQVGEIIDRLKDDGLWENTIVWFFSDHGHGLPRHKRWLLDSGLRVPLLIRIPPAYHHLAGDFQSGDRSRQLVSFVDFAPTVLSLAEITPPEVMQGRSFPGAQPDPPREFIYGARDRADDMFEVSRAVLTVAFSTCATFSIASPTCKEAAFSEIKRNLWPSCEGHETPASSTHIPPRSLLKTNRAKNSMIWRMTLTKSII